MLYWLRQVGVLLILGLTIHLFPTLLSTPETLSDFYTDLWPRSETLRREWRTERAGETVLPGKVQTMLALLREQRAATFRYSDAIAHDPNTSIVQRIAEGAYPIRWSASAQHFLSLAHEAVDARCTRLASRDEVVLAYCP